MIDSDHNQTKSLDPISSYLYLHTPPLEIDQTDIIFQITMETDRRQKTNHPPNANLLQMLMKERRILYWDS